MTAWLWGLLGGLLANELFQLSGWAAQKLVRWSAYIRYEDPERAEIRAEELARVIEDRPGQLLKLITAVCFVLMAVEAWVRRAAAGMSVIDVTVSSASTARMTAMVTVVTAMAILETTMVLTIFATPPEATVPPPSQVSAPILQGKSVADVQTYARVLAAQQGWGATQFACLLQLWNQQSGWRYYAQDPAGTPYTAAYGIPQADPGSKMASVAADWQTNPATQIKWGFGYIKAEYGNPCSARTFQQANGGY